MLSKSFQGGAEHGQVRQDRSLAVIQPLIQWIGYTISGQSNEGLHFTAVILLHFVTQILKMNILLIMNELIKMTETPNALNNYSIITKI